MPCKINQKLLKIINKKNTKLIIGLDVDINKLPKIFKKDEKNVFLYSKNIIDSTIDHVIGYKINNSFYEALGKNGIDLIYKINQYIKNKSNDILIFADTKRAEIGEGVENFKKFYFDYLNFDYLMLVPWFGSDSFQPFINLKNKGISIYLHDSNPSAYEIQDLKLKNNLPLYLELINFYKKIKLIPSDNVIFELGATYLNQLKLSRKILGKDQFILTAGIGKQGGKIEDLKGLFGEKESYLIVSISRSIIFPDEIYHIDNIKKIFQKIKEKTLYYKEKINFLSKK